MNIYSQRARVGNTCFRTPNSLTMLRCLVSYSYYFKRLPVSKQFLTFSVDYWLGRDGGICGEWSSRKQGR